MLGDSSFKLHLFLRPCSTFMLWCYDMPCHITKQCQNHQLITTHIFTNNSMMQTKVHLEVTFFLLKLLQNSNLQGFVANINRTSLAAHTQSSHLCPNPRFLSVRYWGLKVEFLAIKQRKKRKKASKQTYKED